MIGENMFSKKVIVLILSVMCFAFVGGVAFFFAPERIDYGIHFTLNDTLENGGEKPARVILLGGQSNASGCSRDDCLKENVSEEKYTEYSSGYDNVYINYFATGTNESLGFVKCAGMQGEAGGFFGPELGLAEKLHELYPDEQFFIIKYAWGGSNLCEQWRSPSCFGRTGDLYKHFVSFVEDSMEYLISKNYDVKIEAMCWMQGESDSLSENNATDYERNLKSLIKDLRKRFDKYASKDGIAFVDAQIADNPAFWVFCDLVNASKAGVAEASCMNVLIDTNKEGLTCEGEPKESPDLAHYDSMSQIKLGHLFAQECTAFFDREE